MTDDKPKRFRWFEAVVVLIILTVIIALLLPAIQAARLAARRTQRANDIGNIGMGAINFHDTYRHFPPAIRRDDYGRPNASWRYHIAPFLCGWMIDVDLARPWSDPEAHFFLNRTAGYSFDYAGARKSDTNIIGVIGRNTVFDERQLNRVSQFDSRTVLVLEIVDSDLHWMEPGDLSIDRLSDSLMSGIDGLGVLYVAIGGSVSFLSNQESIEVLRPLMTMRRIDQAGGESPVE